jgi:hypothetical protein
VTVIHKRPWGSMSSFGNSKVESQALEKRFLPKPQKRTNPRLAFAERYFDSASSAFAGSNSSESELMQ